MKNHGMVTAIVIFLLIIAGMFIFAFLKKNELSIEPQPSQVETTQTTPYDYITRVDAKHFFINGEHTLVGEIIMPTACDLLTWDARVAESAPEQVIVAFDVINNAENCEQAMTPQRFKVSFTASKEAQISAQFKGRNIDLNIIPAGATETPDDFELFIKG